MTLNSTVIATTYSSIFHLSITLPTWLDSRNNYFVENNNPNRIFMCNSNNNHNDYNGDDDDDTVPENSEDSLFEVGRRSLRDSIRYDRSLPRDLRDI